MTAEDSIIKNEEKKLQLNQGENKYPALKIVITTIRIFAWIGVAVALGALPVAFSDGFRYMAMFLGSSVSALILFAMAESLKVLIDIEYNTRK